MCGSWYSTYPTNYIPPICMHIVHTFIKHAKYLATIKSCTIYLLNKAFCIWELACLKWAKHIALPIKITYTFGSIKCINISIELMTKMNDLVYPSYSIIINHYTRVCTFVNNKHTFLILAQRIIRLAYFPHITPDIQL